MPKGFPVDLDELQQQLWERTDRLGRVKLIQKDLAEILGITKFTMSRVVSRMVEEGRLRHITNSKHLDGVFIVTNPKAEP